MKQVCGHKFKKMIDIPFFVDGIIIWTFPTQGENKIVDQSVLLTISTCSDWNVQWWTWIFWEWPEPYNTDKGQIWFLEVINWRLSLAKQNINQSWVSKGNLKARLEMSAKSWGINVEEVAVGTGA